MVKAKANLIAQSYELDASQAEAESFLKNIVPEPVKNLVGLLGDQTRFWRFKNQVRLLKNVNALVKSNNLQQNKVPLKILVPLLDSSSLEEDESLQKRWEYLLANAVAGEEIGVNYVEILKQLSGTEASILEAVYLNSLKEVDLEKRKVMNFDRDKIAQVFSISVDQAELIIENFYRLGLCRQPGTPGISFGDGMRASVNTTKLFELTSLGYRFIIACNAPIRIV